MVVLGRRHAVEAPVAFVVRMEKDKVSFDAEVAKVSDTFFEVLKEFRIESGEIPIVRRSSFERIQERLVRVPIVVLRENAKTDFVEWSGGEGFESLIFEGGILVNPGIAGGAEFFEGFTVGVGEMEYIRDVYRAMVFCGGLGNGELAGFVVELGDPAAGSILP